MLLGDDGADTIQAGEGMATITGGLGADRIEFSGNSNDLVLTDFVPGTDLIVFSPRVGFGEVGVAPATLLASVLAAATDVGPNSVIQTANSMAATITLQGVLKAAYVEAMFTVAEFVVDEETDEPVDGDEGD